MKDDEVSIVIYNESGDQLGRATSFGEARRLHMQDFEERGEKILAGAYAGINTSEENFGHPLFYMTEEFIEYSTAKKAKPA